MARRTIVYIVDKKTNCWNWIGGVAGGGYGIFKRKNNTQIAVHRYVYQLYKGKIPKKFDLDHLCRNTRCINPKHLEPVTRAENTIRGLSAKLNWKKVKLIRKLYKKDFDQYHLAKKFHIDQSQISRIVNYRAWL